MHRETICALASGPLPSAIAIIRVSGPATRLIGESLLENGLPEPRRAELEVIRDQSGARIDEGLVLFMPGPASYTGEDVLELYLHGGAGVVAHALEALTNFDGVRLAEPGEFTRRAFEAGKLDLTQAEGVADLIEAQTRAQKEQALKQLDGVLSDAYSRWREQLTEALALLEVSIDFSDEGDAPGSTDSPVLALLRGLDQEIEAALADDRVGERIRDGFRIAIIGPPNAGKSTLLNRFAGRDAAIVSHLPGTTRDVIEVRLSLAGMIVWLVDTAGMREADDAIEVEGVRRATRAAEEADLRLILVDGTAPDTLKTVSKFQRPHDLLIANKRDVTGFQKVNTAIAISAETGEGMDELETKITQWLASKTSGSEAPVITRSRHRDGLTRGLDHIKSAIASLEQSEGAELVAEDVRLASRALSSLIGEIGVEDVLGSVFSSFCIGK